MIILDTNVISILMQASPDASAVKWLDRQPPESIWTTSINVFEIVYGLESLAKGKRRTVLHEAFEIVLHQDLEDRILQFDSFAAREAARIAAFLRSKGRPVEVRDVMIAGIAAARHGSLATRNVQHFIDSKIQLVSPWDSF